MIQGENAIIKKTSIINEIVKYEWFYEDGTKSREFYMDELNDHRVGAETTYYENGGIKSNKVYDFDGILKEYVRYHKNGRVKDIMPYTGGVKNGIRRMYSFNGNLTKEIEYVRGVEHGKTIEYDGNNHDVIFYEYGSIKKIEHYIGGVYSHTELYEFGGNINVVIEFSKLR